MNGSWSWVHLLKIDTKTCGKPAPDHLELAGTHWCNVAQEKISMKQFRQQYKASPLLPAACCSPILSLYWPLYWLSDHLQLATTRLCSDTAALPSWNASQNHLGNTSINTRNSTYKDLWLLCNVLWESDSKCHRLLCLLLSGRPWGNLTGVLISLTAETLASPLSPSVAALQHELPATMLFKENSSFSSLTPCLSRARVRTHARWTSLHPTAQRTHCVPLMRVCRIKGQQLFADAVSFTCITVVLHVSQPEPNSKVDILTQCGILSGLESSVSRVCTEVSNPEIDFLGAAWCILKSKKERT